MEEKARRILAITPAEHIFVRSRFQRKLGSQASESAGVCCLTNGFAPMPRLGATAGLSSSATGDAELADSSSRW